MPTSSRPFRNSARTLSPARTEGTVLRFRQLLVRARDPDLDVLSKRILLPSLPVADEDMRRISLWEEGLKLARQDDWTGLSRRIHAADSRRLITAGGHSEAVMLSLGAHADVLAHAEDALNDHMEPDPAGMAALEEVLEEYPGDHALAVVVGYAHIRIAQTWTSINGDLTETPCRHLDRAARILAPYDPVALGAPTLAVTLSALHQVRCGPFETVTGSFRRVIALHPRCPQHLRAYGRHLSADPDLLRREAHRLLKQTEDHWGAAGFAWLYLDALRRAPGLLATVDRDVFIQGLHDILEHTADQHIANDIAAFCALDMRPERSLPDADEATRAALYQCLEWILSKHLHELHPRIWSGVDLPATRTQSANGYRALAAQGRRQALRSIAAYLADQMADGCSIAFSPAGMYRLPAI